MKQCLSGLIYYLGPVDTYPDIFEPATFSIRILLPPTPIRQNPWAVNSLRYVLNPLSRVEKHIRNDSDSVWTVNPDIFESDDVAKSCLVSYRRVNQYGRTVRRPSFSTLNPDTIKSVWTGKIRFEYAICGRGNSWIRNEKVANEKISGHM